MYRPCTYCRWVVHNKEEVWHDGRKWQQRTQTVEQLKESSLLAFNYIKTLKLPTVSTKLNLCNGLIPESNYVFDHMHGFISPGYHNGLASGEGIPYKIAPATAGGQKNTDNKIYFVNIHYQGHAKKYVPYDVCRTLYLQGSSPSSVVNDQCIEAFKGMTFKGDKIHELPCLDRESLGIPAPICV